MCIPPFLACSGPAGAVTHHCMHAPVTRLAAAAVLPCVWPVCEAQGRIYAAEPSSAHVEAGWLPQNKILGSSIKLCSIKL